MAAAELGLIQLTLENSPNSVDVRVYTDKANPASFVEARGVVSFESLDVAGLLGTELRPRPKWLAVLPAGSVPGIDAGQRFVNQDDGKEFLVDSIVDAVNSLTLALREVRQTSG